MTKALIVVDMQNDFLPGGALGVPGGDLIIDSVNQAIRDPQYDLVVASQDFHPPNHISFASRHGKEPFTRYDIYGSDGHIIETIDLWPDHCVQGTHGVGLADKLDISKIDVLARKGTNADREAYSAFNATSFSLNHFVDIRNRLNHILRDYRIDAVDIVGLAYDYCVKNTAIDAANLGYTTTIFKPLTASVFPSNDGKTGEELRNANVTVFDFY